MTIKYPTPLYSLENSKDIQQLENLSPMEVSSCVSSKFSFFMYPPDQSRPSETNDIVRAYKLTQSHLLAVLTQQLGHFRKDPVEANKYIRCYFPSVAYSGTFSIRLPNCLISHSGLIALTFHYVPDKKSLKERLIRDPYFDTALLYMTPDHKGLIWVVSFNEQLIPHKKFAAEAVKLIKANYGRSIVHRGLDICRISYLSYDPQAYINQKYLNGKSA